MNAITSSTKFDYVTGTMATPPEIAVIEPTNRCNLNCVMCYRLEHLGDVGDMSFSLFKQIADSVKGARMICCHGGGEPLLHPDILKMIDYAHEACNPEVLSITTNATLLDHEMAKGLAASKLGVLYASIDGADKRTYEGIRGFSFEQVVENVRYFKSMSRIPIVVQYTVMKDNLQSLLRLPELVRYIGADRINVQHLLKWNRQMEGMRVIDGIYEDFERIRVLVLDEAGKYGVECSIPPIGFIDKCDLPFREAYFNFKGEIAPCCVAVHVSLERSFTDINGDRIREWRRKVGQGEFFEECRRFCYVK